MQKFPRLEETQRKVLSGFSSDVALGVHYCTSWITRTERASEDCDAEHRRSLVSTATNTSATRPRTCILPVVHYLAGRDPAPHTPRPRALPCTFLGPTRQGLQARSGAPCTFLADLTVSNEVDTSDMSWPCLCRYSSGPDDANRSQDNQGKSK